MAANKIIRSINFAKNKKTDEFFNSSVLQFNLKLRFCQSRAGLVLERVLGDFNQLIKRCGVLRGDVGQNFSVERAFRGFEAFHESAVSQTGGARRGVNADLPEITEIAFLGAAVAIGVLTAMVNGVAGVAIQFGTFETEAFGRRQHPFATFAGSG